MKRKCIYCSKEYSTRTINQHERACPINPENKKICKLDSCDNIITSIEKRAIFCSHKCANTFIGIKYRTLENHPLWKGGEFGHVNLRKKECCKICRFDKVVEVHHLNENRNDNTLDNLITLCPNHHRMIHTKKYKKEVMALLGEFVSGQAASLQN